MRPSDNIENLIKNLHVDPSAEMRAMTLTDTLEAQKRGKQIKPAVPQPNIWRTIMKSRISKLAAAAVIIATVMIGFNQFGSSIDIASTAFAQMAEAMADVPCVHVVIEGRRGSVGHRREHWLCFGSGTMAEKHQDGRVHFVNLQRDTRYVYSPDSDTMIVSPVPTDKESLEVIRSPDDLLAQVLTELGISEAKMTLEHGRYEGQDADIYAAELPETNYSPTVKITGRGEVIVAPCTGLPFYATVEGYGPDGAVLLEGRVSFDYQQSMPKDIYDLGVPRSANVIDSLPGPAVEEVLEAYRAHRDSAPAGQSLAVIREIRLRSGKSNLKTKVVEGADEVQSEIQREGWDSTVIGGDPHITEIVIVEDDHSRENDLICIQLLRDGYKRPGMVAKLPFKGLFYINPERDYICEKYQIFALRDPTWEGAVAWVEGDAEQQCSSVSEVVRYGRTTSGKWYPKAKKAQTTILNEDGTTEEYGYNIAIYLDTEPESIEDAFAPEE
jgi:hypothetical protein